MLAALKKKVRPIVQENKSEFNRRNTQKKVASLERKHCLSKLPPHLKIEYQHFGYRNVLSIEKARETSMHSNALLHRCLCNAGVFLSFLY